MKLSYKLRLKRDQIVLRFRLWFPLISKKQSIAERHKALQELETKHAFELEQEHKRVDKLIGDLTKLTWTRDNMNVYRLGLAFDARMMYGNLDRDNLRFIAQMIARQVEGEIASSRFIQKADEPRNPYPSLTEPYYLR